MLELRSPSNQINQARFAATNATEAKVPFVQGGHVFIPINDADAATESNHVYRSEISGAAKTAAEAWAVGAAIYWNDTTKAFTTTSSGNTACGFALTPSLAADTETPLFLFSSFGG